MVWDCPIYSVFRWGPGTRLARPVTGRVGCVQVQHRMSIGVVYILSLSLSIYLYINIYVNIHFNFIFNFLSYLNSMGQLDVNSLTQNDIETI
jgi:hypothetical protein